MGEVDKARFWYEKRIEVEGFVEEAWFSQYMIACGFLKQDKPQEAETWVQRAWDQDPTRPEARLAMVAYYRERWRFEEAWVHLLLAETCQLPENPRLFLEPDAYDQRRVYERSILAFFVPGQKPSGIAAALRYEGPRHLEEHVMQSLSCYAEPLEVLESTRLTFPAPDGYFSSSVACDPHSDKLIVRTVSYVITETGEYLMPSGRVETRNFESTWVEGVGWEGFEELLPPAAAPKRSGEQIVGLEDVRCCAGAYTATTREYSYTDANRMVYWRQDGGFRCLRPPFGENPCEKNWIPTGRDDLVIYDWHPLRLGRVVPDADDEWTGSLEICIAHSTPKAFRHFRGSSVPFPVGDELWVVVHIVCPYAPRHYLHVLVALDKEDWRPLAASQPFHFKRRGIEYCLGARTDKSGLNVDFFHSVHDNESWHSRASVAACRELLRPLEYFSNPA